jgi:hypothetical protein
MRQGIAIPFFSICPEIDNRITADRSFSYLAKRQTGNGRTHGRCDWHFRQVSRNRGRRYQTCKDDKTYNRGWNAHKNSPDRATQSLHAR